MKLNQKESTIYNIFLHYVLKWFTTHLVLVNDGQYLDAFS